MLQKVVSTIEKYKMIKNGDTIVVGLSGGADSMCLLHVLNSIKDQFNIKLIAVHINHSLRGEEADRDEQVAKEFSNSLSINYFPFKLDVKSFAKDNNLTEEEAGRNLRYARFYEVLKEHNANKIAVAHHKNDSVETVFINLIRGTGLKGLIGISPKNDKIIRPLIDCSREEIEEYCLKNNINYVIDSTNKKNIYTRNKVRNELIPYIKENINANVINNIYRTQKLLEEEEAFLERFAKQAYKGVIIKTGKNNIQIDIKKLKENDTTIIKRILRIAICELSQNELKDIDYQHVNDILNIMNNQSGKRINRPNNIIVRRNFDELMFYIENESQSMDYEHKIKRLPTKIGLENIEFKIDIVENINVKDSENIKYFDYEKINIDVLSIRNRREGDYIYLKKESERQRLKKFFTDHKISLDERNRLPLLAQNNNVLWIVGYKSSPYFSISSNTKKLLRVEIRILGN